MISKWGREEIVGDYARLIRTLRPDVIVTMGMQGRGGDRAHEATTILAYEGYLAAGDPSKYPEQIAQGLRPWQPKKIYFTANAGAVGVPPSNPPDTSRSGLKPTPVDTAAYDTLFGRTYQEIASDARSFHKCQGMARLLPELPGVPGGRGFPGAGGYRLMETSIPGQKTKEETSLFDGIDVSLTGIAQYAGANPPAALTAALATILADAKEAQNAFAAGNDAGTAKPVEAGLAAVRALRSRLGSLGLSDTARYEIDFRLKLKEGDYENAVLLAHDLNFDAVADDGLVIAGQPVRLSILAQNRGASDVAVTGVTVAGFDGAGACQPANVKQNAAFTCTLDAHIPNGAPPTTPYFHDDYWKHPENHAIQIFDAGVPFGVPFAPTAFTVTFHVKAGEVEVSHTVPVEYRYVNDIFLGDKRMELNVVPALSVSLSPALVVIPAPQADTTPVTRKVHVSVTNGAKGQAQVNVALQLPPGWTAEPAGVPLTFAHEDESLSARFQVTAPRHVKTGEFTLRAVATSPTWPGVQFSNGYHVIEYPHIQRRQIMKPAEASLKVIDVKTAPNLSVGYIVGVGDQVPAAIEQLGARIAFIEPEELAWGDLSKYDVIVTGVRAYERRADLRAYNRRLLDYAERGGTVIVQYNKTEFNQADYGPYPAKVSGNRVSDETVPVKVLAPNDPLFHLPNPIGPATWDAWVQERGLYFLGDKDPRYVDLVSMVDSFPDNPGEKLGSFVEAKTGKGTWIYLGLGLWRQLPAGTDGAYQLLANLISLPRTQAAQR